MRPSSRNKVFPANNVNNANNSSDNSSKITVRTSRETLLDEVFKSRTELRNRKIEIDSRDSKENREDSNRPTLMTTPSVVSSESEKKRRERDAKIAKDLYIHGKYVENARFGKRIIYRSNEQTVREAICVQSF